MALKSGNVAPDETELLELVRTQPPPQHVAVIMDGNGRWATRRGLPRVAGHSEGVKAARTIVRAADALGIRYLTLYAFSSENWSRPSDEVAMLMSLLERSIHRELPELMARNVRLRVIGRAEGVPHEVKRGIDNVMDETAGNTGMTLFMAFNYGGARERVDPRRALARPGPAGGRRPGDIADGRHARAPSSTGAPRPRAPL